MEHLTFNPNWKRRDDLISVNFKEGDLLGDLATENGFDPIQKNLMTGIINGEIVDDWQNYAVQANDHVRVLMLPRGGHGGGKKALVAVAAIAIAVVSYGAASNVSAAMLSAGYGSTAAAIGGAAASIAVSVAGNVIMGAIAQHMYKPPSQSLSSSQGATNPFFDISPSGNIAQPYGSVPMLLGRMKLYPRLISQPEIESVGDHRTIVQAFDFGFGTLSLSNERFGNASIANNPALIEHYINSTFTSGSDLVIANRLVQNLNIGANMRDEKSSLTFTTPLLTKELLIEFNFSGGLVKYLNNGNKEETEVEFEVQYKKTTETVWIDGFITGSYVSKYWFTTPQGVDTKVNQTDMKKLTIKGKYFGTARVGMNLAFSSASQYDIRILRKTTSGQAHNISNICAIDFVRAIEQSAGKLVNLVDGVKHTIAELKVQGTKLLNGKLDNYSAIATSEVYTWNKTLGSWDQLPTRNPAWLFIHVLTTAANRHRLPVERNGALDNTLMRKYFDVDQIIKWADWCDTNNFYCDMIVSARTTVREVLTTITSAGLATWVRNDGRFSVVYEGENRTPVHIVTPNNSKNFHSKMTYAKKPIGLRVKFANEDLDYQQDEIIVNADYNQVDANNNPLILQNYESLELPNVTNVRQATILGRFFMAQAENRRERITFDMDIENLAVQRGDILAVAHDVLAAGGVPVRVLEVDKTDPTHDVVNFSDILPSTASPAVQSSWGVITRADNYQDTHAVFPKGQFQGKVGDLYIAGGAAVEQLNYMVEEIRASRDLSASILAVEYGGSLFNSLISGAGIPTRQPKLGYDTSGKILPVNVRNTVENIVDNRQRFYRITLIWNQPTANIDHYIITDNAGAVIGNTADNQFVLPLVADGDLISNEIRYYNVTPVSITGATGASSQTKVELVKDITPPYDVTEFSSNVQDQLTHLTWRSVQQLDVAGYEIRYSSDVSASASWGNSVRAVDFLPWDATEASVPSRIGTYFIKAFDSAGNYSQNAASSTTIISTLDMHVDDTVIQPNKQGGNWSNIGSASNLKVGATPGTIELIHGAYEGIYHLSAPYDIGRKEKVHLAADVNMAVIASNEHLDDPWFDPLAHAIPLSPLLADTPNIADAQVYFRISDDGSTWSPWTRLLATDCETRYIDMQVRVYSKDGVATPRVRNATITVSYIKRYERGYDVSVGSSGKTVNFGNAYTTKPSVSITLQNAAAGDSFKMTATASGFTVHIYDAAKHAKSGSIDWISVGHGKVI